MLGALVVVFLQVGTPAPANPAESQTSAAAPVAIPEGMMDCQLDRATRTRTCTTSEGEVLRCRRERTLGSRFRTWVCFTYSEDEQIQRDSQSALDRQQRITTPGGS